MPTARVVLQTKNNKFLLEELLREPNKGLTRPIGGHSKQNETPIQTLKRELAEEYPNHQFDLSKLTLLYQDEQETVFILPPEAHNLTPGDYKDHINRVQKVVEVDSLDFV